MIIAFPVSRAAPRRPDRPLDEMIESMSEACDRALADSLKVSAGLEALSDAFGEGAKLLAGSARLFRAANAAMEAGDVEAMEIIRDRLQRDLEASAMPHLRQTP